MTEICEAKIGTNNAYLPGADGVDDDDDVMTMVIMMKTDME